MVQAAIKRDTRTRTNIEMVQKKVRDKANRYVNGMAPAVMTDEGKDKHKHFMSIS